MASKRQKKYQKKILSILKDSRKPSKISDLKKELNITKKHVFQFDKTLEFLVQSGKIRINHENGIISLISGSRLVVGELRITRGGFGFVRAADQEIDIFINRDHLNTAFDRDTVEVKLYAKHRGKNQEGFVTKVLERYRAQFVGTFHQTRYYGFVVPDDNRVYRDFFIPKEKQHSAKDGQKVLVKLESWPTDHLNPEGQIVEIIGFAGEPGVDVATIAHSFEISTKFPEAVESEARQKTFHLDDDLLQHRLDLRPLEVFTIDPEDAKDFDDAVSLQKLENGNYSLGVHIADVSFYVNEKSHIDKEAFKRGTSVYLVDRVIPMLPESLSNDLCSLQPNVEKLTYSCLMEITPDVEVISYVIQPSVIISKRRFTYEEAQQIIDNDLESPFSETLHEMIKLSKLLTKKRFDEGGIDFETPEVIFELNSKGFPTEIRRRQRLDSHRLIEEFMLLANKTVATHVRNLATENLKYPFIYRVHEKPDEEKMKHFFEFLHALGVKFQPAKRVTSRYFQSILTKIKGTKEEFVIEEVALRSMMKAIYSTKNIGHFGLGFENYTHFTSPIRRYPDLIVHRLLKDYIKTEEMIDKKSLSSVLDRVCYQSNIAERTALEAERESIRKKQIEYISDKIGEEFEGVISGVMSFGIFVELVETLVEGLVHIRDLDDDYYIHDEKTYTLIGRDTDRTLRLGDLVKIKVADVNIEEGKVDFALLN